MTTDNMNSWSDLNPITSVNGKQCHYNHHSLKHIKPKENDTSRVEDGD